MSTGANPGEPKIRVQVQGGQGVQIGSGNEQFNQFNQYIQNYIENPRQSATPGPVVVGRCRSGRRRSSPGKNCWPGWVRAARV